jgi:Na+-transporting NADH:ubiquinone oxidoreductase subunit NqrB
MACLMLQIVGVIFPVMIMALVPIRQYIMPYIFSHHTLHELDAAEYEEAPAIADEAAAREAADNVELVGKLGPTEITSSFCIFYSLSFPFSVQQPHAVHV